MSDDWGDAPTSNDAGFMGGDSYPALAFANIGDTHEGVVRAVKRKQDQDFVTKEPMTWPNGDPKYVWLFEIEQANGEMGTIWVRGNAVKAIRDATTAAGAGSPVGWQLKLQHHAQGEAKGGGKPPKLYRAKLTPAPARAAASGGPAYDEEPF